MFDKIIQSLSEAEIRYKVRYNVLGKVSGLDIEGGIISVFHKFDDFYIVCPRDMRDVTLSADNTISMVKYLVDIARNAQEQG